MSLSENDQNACRADVFISSDLYADVAARWGCQNYYGYDKWFAGHRNGASGLANPNTADINSKCTIMRSISGRVLTRINSLQVRYPVDPAADR